jgi:tetratricopeptide (TPR) repeat protein
MGRLGSTLPGGAPTSMPKLVLQLAGFRGQPSLEINLEDGAVSGLEKILPEVRDDGTIVGLTQALMAAAEALEQGGGHAAACNFYAAIARVVAAAGRGLDHAITLNNLALALKRTGRMDEARSRYEEALALLRTPLASLDDDRLRILQLAKVLLNLAILWHERGDGGKVRQYAGWAKSAIEGEDHPDAQRIREQCEKILA